MALRLLLRFWLYLPLVAIPLGVGYATDHMAAAAIGLGALLVSWTTFAVWGRRHREVVRERIRRDPAYGEQLRRRGDRWVRIWAFWIVGSLAFMVLVVVVDIAYRLATR